jgi:hypothetical protein
LLSLYHPYISGIIVSIGLVTPVWLLPYLIYLKLYSNVFFILLPTYGITQMFDILDTPGIIHFPHFISWLMWFVLFSVWLAIKYRPLMSRG